MTTKMPKIATVFLFASALAVTACDDDVSNLDPGQSLRVNVKFKTPKIAGTTFNSSGTCDDCPVIDLPFPLPDVLRQQIARNSDEVFAAGWRTTEEPEWMCHEACAEDELEWTGDVRAEGDYYFGEAISFEGEDGSVQYRVDVEAEVAFSCACAVEG